jgi:4-amino-4-deoxy-L-arabinose transferase-like glycosyltransferase
MIDILLHPQIYHKYLLAFAIGLILLAVFFHVKGKNNYAIAALILGALFLRFFMILLDPFLNWWDEQYHALVAKNLINNPLRPILIEECPVPSDPLSWVEGNIWLHKQPLFLWQMALSLKIFGINEFAVRIPSALLNALSVLLVNRIGQLAINKSAGFYAALFFTIHLFSLELLAGVHATDHNDISFLFYVTASIWAFIEFYYSGNKKWLILIGIFSGAAILVKWLVGLLVFLGWGMLLLYKHRLKIFNLAVLKPLLIALFVTVIVAIPWQVYIFSAFPDVAASEYAHAAAHFNEVIEGHDGGFLYHFDNIKFLYSMDPWLVLFLILFFAAVVLKDNLMRVFFLVIFFGVYLFYSLAATKMPAFPLVVAPVVFLATGSFFYFIEKNLQKFTKQSTLIVATIVVLALYLNFDADSLIRLHAPNSYRELKTHNANLYKELVQIHPEVKGRIIFNCRYGDHIQARFYSGLDIYDYKPDENLFNTLKSAGHKMAFFQYGELPDFVINDPEVYIIPSPIQ